MKTTVVWVDAADGALHVSAAEMTDTEAADLQRRMAKLTGCGLGAGFVGVVCETDLSTILDDLNIFGQPR